MKKRNYDYEISPLMIVQSINNAFPDIWGDMDMLFAQIKDKSYKLMESEVPSDTLNQFCKPTLDLAERNLLCNRYRMDLSQILLYGLALPELAEWRKNKIVYFFDETLEQELTKSEEVDITSDILAGLPYRCFYIKTSTLNSPFSEHDVTVKEDGYIVSFSYDQETLTKNLNLTACYDKLGAITTTIPIGNHIQMDTTKKEEQPVIKTLSDRIKKGTEDTLVNQRKVLQLILYIASSNCDIKPESKKTGTYRYHPNPQPFELKDRHREIKRWDVGSRIGPILKKSCEANMTANKSSAGTGNSKRPHMRRAHWHRFWIGSEVSGTRRLTIKWLHPMLINAQAGVDLPATLCRVD